MTLDELKSLIDSFYPDKQQVDKLKKIADTKSASIKEAMRGYDIDSITTAGNLCATLTTVQKQEIDEDKLLQIVMAHIDAEQHPGLIVPTVNTKVLEDLIYEGKISADVQTLIASCITPKIEYRLSVKPIKTKK